MPISLFTDEIFIVLINIFLTIVIYLPDDIIRVVMVTWLTLQMIGLSKFYIMATFQVDTLLSYEVMAENVIGEVISGATQYSYNPYFLLYHNFHIFVN